MTAVESIKLFLNTRDLSTFSINFKKRVLYRFYSYIEQNYDLPDGWNFNKVKKIVYNNSTFYMAIDRVIIANYLSAINNDVTDYVYNKHLTCIKQFMDHLVENNILKDNPAKNIKPKKLISRDMTPYRLNLDEALALLFSAYHYDVTHRNRNFTLVQLLLSTATRIGEAVTLTEEGIRFENDIIYVCGKSNNRIRFLGPGLKESLKELLRDPQRASALKGHKTEYVFYSDKGGPLSTIEANELLKKIAEKAGISKNITTYWLRRSYANILADNNFSITEIKFLFDHDRIKNTEKYLEKKKVENLREVVNNSTTIQILEEVLKASIGLAKR